mgnify:CR=1 FL=1
MEGLTADVHALLNRFWPGGLTVVLRRRGQALDDDVAERLGIVGTGFDYVLDRGTVTLDARFTWGFTNVIMSGDFEVAIEEGATMVRIGQALFDGVS